MLNLLSHPHTRTADFFFVFLMKNHGCQKIVKMAYFEVLEEGEKRNPYQLRILCLAELSLKNEGESKMFPNDEQKLRVFLAAMPDPQEMLKGVLQDEMKTHWTLTQSHKKN